MRRALFAPVFGMALLLPAPALAQEARSCEPADLSALAGWHGVWIHEGLFSDVSGRAPLGDTGQGAFMHLLGSTAPWNDHGWAGYEAFIRSVSTSSAQAQGWSFPMMMQTAAPLRFFVTPQETVIISQYRDVRYVPTDGRGMLPDEERWPTIWGTSAGCWEGDMLVIETASAAFTPSYDFIAPHLSDEARFVERLRLVSPDRIEGSITITDPATLSEVWTVQLSYERHPFLDRMVHEGDMSSDNRVVEVDGVGIILPPDESGPPPGPVFPAELALGADALAQFVGTYAIDGAPPGTVLPLTLRGNRLYMPSVPGRPGVLPLYAHAEDVVHSRALVPLELHFVRDAGGNVTGFSGINAAGEPYSGTRLP